MTLACWYSGSGATWSSSMNAVKAFSAASAICINHKHAATIVLTEFTNMVDFSVTECTLNAHLDVAQLMNRQLHRVLRMSQAFDALDQEICSTFEHCDCATTPGCGTEAKP